MDREKADQVLFYIYIFDDKEACVIWARLKPIPCSHAAITLICRPRLTSRLDALRSDFAMSVMSFSIWHVQPVRGIEVGQSVNVNSETTPDQTWSH